ncbi:MAG: TetR/AcrR family transcriptional regulator [Lachnospiraceae bacterium]
MSNRGDKTRDLICREACRLFAEKGFKEVTMKDICERTGLSRGGLYRHYDSTEQIFGQMIEKLTSNQEDDISAKIDKKLPAVQILNEILQKYYDEMLDHKESLSIAFCEFFSRQSNQAGPSLLYQQYLFSKATWEALILYGIETGEFKNQEPAAVYDILVFAYQGVRMYSKLMPIDESTAGHIITIIKTLLIREYEEEA